MPDADAAAAGRRRLSLLVLLDTLDITAVASYDDRRDMIDHAK